MDHRSEVAVALRAQARANVLAKTALEAAKTHGSDKYFVYALLLNEGKIYVGQTDNVYQRLLDHFTMSRSTSAWVRMHGPPVRILEVVVDADACAENYMTLDYISRFGADNVRGGVWNAVFCNAPPIAANFRPDKVYDRLSRAEIDAVFAEIQDNAQLCHRSMAAN